MWGWASCQDKWGALHRKGTTWWAGKGPEVLSTHVGAVTHLHVSMSLGSCLARGQLWRAGLALAFQGIQKWSAASTHVSSSSAFSPIEKIFLEIIVIFFFFGFQ